MLYFSSDKSLRYVRISNTINVDINSRNKARLFSALVVGIVPYLLFKSLIITVSLSILSLKTSLDSGREVS